MIMRLVSSGGFSAAISARYVVTALEEMQSLYSMSVKADKIVGVGSIAGRQIELSNNLVFTYCHGVQVWIRALSLLYVDNYPRIQLVDARFSNRMIPA